MGKWGENVDIEGIDYEAVIEDLKARKAKAIADFDGAIAAIELLILGKALAGNGATFEAGPESLGTEIEPDTFFNLSATEAQRSTWK